jgi:hypothetical protein
MKRTITRTATILILSLMILLFGCARETEKPVGSGISAPEAVALSLSTVNPEDSLYLFDYDRDAPIDIQEEETWREGKATWIKFSYASPMGGRVDAKMAIPDGKGPFPAILLQHGGTGSLEDMVPVAKEFVRRGAVCLMFTDPYRRPGGWELTEYMGNTWPIFDERDLRIKIQLIQDQRRAIDILERRQEVDPERMAYFGNSFGGAMGGLLAGVEDRLVAYVLQVGDGGLVEHTSDPGPDGLNIHFSENWATLMWPTESLHFIGRAAPAAILFQNALVDIHTLPHDALRYQTAASEPKTVMWYPTGHGLPWYAVDDAAEWLQGYLGDKLYLLPPNYRRSAVVYDRGLIGLEVLVVGVYLWDSTRRKYLGWSERIIWLLIVLLSGPVGLALYWCTARFPRKTGNSVVDIPRWRQALGATSLSTMGLVLALFLGDKINDILSIADFRPRLLQSYLSVMVFGWLISLLLRRSYRTSLLAHILAANLIWVMAMLFPGLMEKYQHVSAWDMYPLYLLVGIVITLPLHWWLLHRGSERWVLFGGDEAATAPLARFPLPLAIVLVVLSTSLAVWSVFKMVQLVSGLPWNQVVMVMQGKL